MKLTLSAIIDGIKHVCQSAQFQDLQAIVVKPWRREPATNTLGAT